MGAFRRMFGAEARPAEAAARGPAGGKVLLIGTPNVGKSALFNQLTGRYVTVSNYPGTTVEVSRGKSRVAQGRYEIIDTPGMYSLTPITDEERVACRLLMAEDARAVVHVLDAKNIQRMLGLTLQLIEAGLPVVVALNMSDEARKAGIHIDADALEEVLGVPVVETVATTGKGVTRLAVEVRRCGRAKPRPVPYGEGLEDAVSVLAAKLGEGGRLSARAQAMLLLQGESEWADALTDRLDPATAEEVRQIVRRTRVELEHSPHYHASVALKGEVDRILTAVARFPAEDRRGFRETLSRLCMHPLTGVPLLLAVLYFGLYQIVGVFGAGTVVDFLESDVFEQGVNPWVIDGVHALLPWDHPAWQSVRELIAGEYGIITLGVRYAVAIVLPIVGLFFVIFSILEDSGYLPRLAMLIDRVFKKIGLSGRAVIPIVLGFGCATMATMVTRTLESKREKIIACILLALAIPCSAQLAVILGLLSGHSYAVAVWAGFVGLTFLVAGFLTARLMPGDRPSFYMELPPLRLPRPMNVLVKTYTRVVWYFKEVLPLFVLASVLIWLGQLTHLFDAAVRGLTPLVHALGLPDKAAVAFLFGFFRRDYGAAGLYDASGAMTGNQLTVAAITLTLFLPCIAQLLILKKERGWGLALGVSASVAVVAFGVGFVVHGLLTALGVSL